MNAIPKPIKETGEAVLIARDDWLKLLEAIADLDALARSTARRAALGDATYNRLNYTAAEVNRMLDDGIAPVTIWREREGLTQRALAERARVAVSYLSEIERGKKPGSAAAYKALAAALNVPMEILVTSV